MFFIVLSLTILSCVHAQSVLITCNAGCGCVTETGVAVACSFIKSSETAVIRATETPTGQFVPVRIVQIQSEDTVVQSDPSLQFTCPIKAGAAVNDGYPMCNPINSSSIPKTPVRISEDVLQDLEPEHVEHFVSPIGNLSLVVRKQIGFQSGCSVRFHPAFDSVRDPKIRNSALGCNGIVSTNNQPTKKHDSPSGRGNAFSTSCHAVGYRGRVNTE